MTRHSSPPQGVKTFDVQEQHDGICGQMANLYTPPKVRYAVLYTHGPMNCQIHIHTLDELIKQDISIKPGSSVSLIKNPKCVCYLMFSFAKLILVDSSPWLVVSFLLSNSPPPKDP